MKKATKNQIPKGITAAEWKDILEYRRTGIMRNIPYEELDFDKVGGKVLKSSARKEKPE